MNRFLRKVTIGITTIAVTLSSFSISIASPLFLHEDKTIKNLSSGVIHENIKQFHSDGWWNINVLKVNLDDPYTNLGLLYNKNGISQNQILTNMLKNSDAIGAVNADFFSMSNPAFPLGAAVDNGKIVSSPQFNEGRGTPPVFSIDNAKNPSIAYWNWDINVVAENGSTLPVITINKNSGSQHHAIVFNDSWGGVSHYGSNSNVVDLVVKDGVVVEKRVGQAPIYVPYGGFIVSGRGPARDFLVNNFNVGSKLVFKTSGNVNFDSLTAAVSGGSWLLKDGAKTNFDTNIRGNRARTAVGITQNKKQVLLVTVDEGSKSSGFSGVSQEVMASIMKYLGAHDALNLDGGGSTTMAIKEDSNVKLVNNPSGGSQRAISNALGVYNNAPKGVLRHIELSVEDKNMFVNTSRNVTVKGYDDYYKPVDVKLEDVVFSIEGIDGTFEGNKLVASSTGIGKIKANLNGITSELDITVLGNIKELQSNKDTIFMPKSHYHFIGNLYGIDKNGRKAIVDSKDIDWEVVNNIGSVGNGVLYTKADSTTGAIIGRLGDAVKTIYVSTSQDSKAIDDLENLNDITTSTYPKDTVGMNIGLSDDCKVGNKSIKINYDFTKTDATRAAYVEFGQGKQLNGNPTSLGLWINGNGDNTWVRGDIVDGNGQNFKIDFAKKVDWTGWKEVSAIIPSGAKYPIKLKSIYVAQVDPNIKNTNSILIDGLTGLFAGNISEDYKNTLPKSTTFVDENNKQVEVSENGYKFLASFVSNTNTFRNILSNNKYAFVLGGLDPNISNGLNTSIVSLDNGFQVVKDTDTAFIKVNNAGGGIRASNAEQWLWFKSALANANEKNIVIMLPRSIYGFTDKMEQKILHDLISEYKSKGKNLYVVYGGNKTAMELKDGVRYFEINLNQSGTYVQFAVDNGEVNYKILPIN